MMGNSDNDEQKYLHPQINEESLLLGEFESSSLVIQAKDDDDLQPLRTATYVKVEDLMPEKILAAVDSSDEGCSKPVLFSPNNRKNLKKLGNGYNLCV